MNHALSSLPAATAQRGAAHAQAMLLGLGRHTLSGCLTSQSRQHLDWTADYRAYSSGRLDADRLFEAVLEQAAAVHPDAARLWLALDDSTLRKSGRRVPRTAWRRDPLSPPFGVNFQWGHRVLQASLLCPQPQGGARGLPVAFEVLLNRPSKQQQCCLPPAALKEALQQANVNHAAVAQLNRLAPKMARPAVAAVDGRFANKHFLRQLPPQVSAVARLRKDAVLYQRPAPSGSGRPRLYGALAARPEQFRSDESQPWQLMTAYAAGKRHDFKIKTQGPLRSKLTGNLDGRLMVIAPLGYRLRAGGKLLYRQPAYLWITDIKMSVPEALQGYLWRWEVEVNFRDEKTLLGVGQPQVWHAQSVQRLPAWQVASYSAMLWCAMSRGQSPGEFITLPQPKWRRRIQPQRASTQSLINQLRYDAWAGALRPQTFQGFWAGSSTDQSHPKSPNPLAGALFLSQG
ncbi:MAG: transposase [Verrucomicrobiia bacterium]